MPAGLRPTGIFQAAHLTPCSTSARLPPVLFGLRYRHPRDTDTRASGRARCFRKRGSGGMTGLTDTRLNAPGPRRPRLWTASSADGRVDVYRFLRLMEKILVHLMENAGCPGAALPSAGGMDAASFCGGRRRSRGQELKAFFNR